MVVRIKFAADIYIAGKDMAEVKKNFESMQLFSEKAEQQCYAEFNELLLVEDGYTNEDLMKEYNNA